MRAGFRDPDGLWQEWCLGAFVALALGTALVFFYLNVEIGIEDAQRFFAVAFPSICATFAAWLFAGRKRRQERSQVGTASILAIGALLSFWLTGQHNDVLQGLAELILDPIANFELDLSRPTRYIFP